jgi:hypothetical protein
VLNTTTTRHDATRAVRHHSSGSWIRRFLLLATACAAVWLSAFVAESRADGGIDAVSGQAVEALDPDTTTPPADTTTTPPADTTTTPPADTTTPPPADTTTPPPADTTTPPPADTTTPPETGGIVVPPPQHGATGTMISTDASASLPSDLLNLIAGSSSTSGGGGNPAQSPPADTSNSGKSGSPQPTPLPHPPMPHEPWFPTTAGGAGGVFGGSGGAPGGAGALGALSALFGLFLAQRLGSRLSMKTTPLHGAAPAFQLKRPG